MTETEPLKKLIAEKLGFVERKLWSKEIKQGLKAMSDKYHQPPEVLCQKILANDALLKELAEHLSVGESYFFRHPEHFNILTKILQEHRSSAPFTIVSLGCAGGEEVYSIAISMAVRLPPMTPPNYTILGVDMNEKACRWAETGEYMAWSFRTTPPRLIARYFEPISGGKSRIKAELKQFVSFENAYVSDWLGTRPDRTVDVFFFRNVAIYLKPEKLASLVNSIARVLKPGGLLIMAPTDPFPIESGFLRYGPNHSRVYTLPATSMVAKQPALSQTKQAKGAQRMPPGIPRALPVLSRTLRPAVFPAATDIDQVQNTSELSAMDDPDRVIRQLSERIHRDPLDVQAYHLRGQTQLAYPRYDRAAEDFRRLLFLAPEHKLGRYWYALVLACSKRISDSERQVEELCRQLTVLSPEQRLEDGATSVHELNEAISAIKEVY